MKKLKSHTLIAFYLSAILLISGCTLAGNNPGGPDNSAPDGGNSAGSGRAVVYFFWGDGCPHCTTQKAFLDEMKNKYPDLELKSYETWNDRENADLLQRLARAYGAEVQGVPTTFIGDHEPLVGFAEFMKADLENKIKVCVEQGCTDPGLKL